MNLTQAQRTLLGIIESVESGVTTPETAVEELTKLKADAAKAGLQFKADYTLEDFQKLREQHQSQYESSGSYVEESFETSESF